MNTFAATPGCPSTRPEARAGWGRVVRRRPGMCHGGSSVLSTATDYDSERGCEPRDSSLPKETPSSTFITCSSSRCAERLASLEREMAHLRESTKAALEQSWAEVEELQQRNSELGRELATSKSGEEFWRQKYEEASSTQQNVLNLQKLQQEQQQWSSTVQRRAASIIAEDDDGMLNIVGNDVQDRCSPEDGILKKLRRRCSIEMLGNSSDRQVDVTSPAGKCSSKLQNIDNSSEAEEENTVSTTCTTSSSVAISCYADNGTTKSGTPSSKDSMQGDSLATLGSTTITAFSSLRSILGERGRSWREGERKKMEAGLLGHLSRLEAEKDGEIEELRLKLKGRDAAIASMEEGLAAATQLTETDEEQALRAETDGLRRRLAQKKAVVADQAKMIAELQEYITELCNELSEVNVEQSSF